MKNLLLIVCFGICIGISSCEEPTPHIIFNGQDSAKYKMGPTIVKDNYEGAIPDRDMKVTDYTWPNPYQHKPQLLRDSTWATSWDAAGFPNAKHFIAFYKTFQWDVMDKNKEKIAGMIKFPLKNFKDKKDFISHFDSVFAHDYVQELLDQNPLEIYRDQKGAMIGNDGQLWFKQVGGVYKIIEIKP